MIMEVSKFPSFEVEEFHDLMEETALNYREVCFHFSLFFGEDLSMIYCIYSTVLYHNRSR